MSDKPIIKEVDKARVMMMKMGVSDTANSIPDIEIQEITAGIGEFIAELANDMEDGNIGKLLQEIEQQAEFTNYVLGKGDFQI